MKTTYKWGLGALGLSAIVISTQPITANAGPGANGAKKQRLQGQEDGPGERGPHGGHRGGRHRGPNVERMAEELGLTAQQQQQVKAIFEEQRQQMEKLREATRQKMDAVLTAEQHAKMQELREQHRPPAPPADGQ